MEKEIEMKPDQDYAIRAKTPEEKSRWNEEETGEYRVKIDLTTQDADGLQEACFLEFDALKAEREENGLEGKWESRDNQYDGQLAPIKSVQFAIDVRESKIKVDSLVMACKEAFLPDDGDIVDVSPRPETARNDGWEIAEKQQQFISFAMDEEIRPETALTLAWQSTFKKYVGVIKQCWSYRQEVRRREEHWEGKITVVGVDQRTGQEVLDNEGLRRFLQAYPDAPTRYPRQVKMLMEGKSVDIVVMYKEQVRNNPQYKYVKIEDFYVRNACDGNEGLPLEHLIGERQMYSYWELVKMQECGDFQNIEDLWSDSDKEGDSKGSSDYKTKEYAIMEFTTYYKAKGDKSEQKIKCWFSEEKKVFLGCIRYPYYAVDCDYTAFYATVNDKGFYGDAESVMFDLRDTHIAQDALISLMLHSIYVRNIITPIVREGSQVEQMFLDHSFDPTKPLPVDDLTDDVNKAMSFVQWPANDTQGGLIMLEKLKRIGSDVARVSDLVTGGESAVDPSAPASKTIALLQQSGVGIKNYIRTLVPSFNITAGNVLQIYYQMSTDDRKYRIRAKGKQVTGKDIFAGINREEMVVRTNIQSRAAAFAFDKAMEKREGMAAYQLLTTNPYTVRQPKILYKALKTLMSTFGGRWKTLGDVDLLSPEDFDKQQMSVAMQAVQALFQQAQQQAQTTGVAKDPREVIKAAPGAVTQAQAETYDPRLAQEEQK